MLFFASMVRFGHAAIRCVRRVKARPPRLCNATTPSRAKCEVARREATRLPPWRTGNPSEQVECERAGEFNCRPGISRSSDRPGNPPRCAKPRSLSRRGRSPGRGQTRAPARPRRPHRLGGDDEKPRRRQAPDTLAMEKMVMTLADRPYDPVRAVRPPELRIRDSCCAGCAGTGCARYTTGVETLTRPGHRPRSGAGPSATRNRER